MSDGDSIDNSSQEKLQSDKPLPRSKKRRFTPIKIANQIPKKRRMEIEKALEDQESTPKKWTRNSGPKNHNFLRTEKFFYLMCKISVSYTHLTLPTKSKV